LNNTQHAFQAGQLSHFHPLRLDMVSDGSHVAQEPFVNIWFGPQNNSIGLLCSKSKHGVTLISASCALNRLNLPLPVRHQIHG
jgi:hypothetical protein